MPRQRRRQTTTHKVATGGAHSADLDRQISAKLRAAHITGPATWYKNPGFRNPADLINAPPYALKQRFQGTSDVATPLTLHPLDLAADTLTAGFDTVQVTRIDVWGPTGDSTIVCGYSQPIRGETNTTRRIFVGTGTEGAQRPYVSASISPTVAYNFKNTDRFGILTVLLYGPNGARHAGDCLVDVWTTWTSSPSQLESTSLRLIIPPKAPESHTSGNTDNDGKCSSCSVSWHVV